LVLIQVCHSFTWVFREAYRERRLLDFVLKEILLVQEEDDGSVCEPFVVANGIKQLQTLVHSVLLRWGENEIRTMKNTHRLEQKVNNASDE
jgi:hypothetical protein